MALAIRGQPVTHASVRPNTLRIQPTRGWVALRLGEVVAYRELLFFLVWRDLKVRYRQTVLGIAWAVLQPLLTMLVFTLFFGRLARVPSDGVPYSLFAYTALVPWTFFATGLVMASNSLVASAALITKVYFPRLTIPLATVLASLVDFALTFPLLFGLMWYRGVAPTANVVWLPAFIALAFATALGVGLWLSALNVEFRDVRHVVPFLTQLWLFATPIAYPSSLLPEQWRAVYALNPMVGVVEGFRWALLGTDTRPGPMIAVSALAALALLVSGAFFFRRMERTFADVV
jgi:lipopolysaccharide transport system permease protein